VKEKINAYRGLYKEVVANIYFKIYLIMDFLNAKTHICFFKKDCLFLGSLFFTSKCEIISQISLHSKAG